MTPKDICTCHTVPVMPFPDIAVDPKCPLHGKRVDVVSPQPGPNKGWADSTVKGQPTKPTDYSMGVPGTKPTLPNTPTSQGGCGFKGKTEPLPSYDYTSPCFNGSVEIGGVWGHRREPCPQCGGKGKPTSQGAPEPINTHHLTIDFGKHKGERWTRLPIGYLVWLVNEGTQVADIAQAELDRRGYTPPTELVVSDHAIDRASLHCRVTWHKTALSPDEGLVSWLKRITQEAIEKGDAKEQDDATRYRYLGMDFVVAQGKLFPTLKTVIRKKDIRDLEELRNHDKK